MRVNGVMELLKKCQSLVNVLHFRGYLLEDETAKEKDKVVMMDLMEKTAETNEQLELDEQISLGIPDDDHADPRKWMLKQEIRNQQN
jgi:hypothetical protein